MHRHGYIGRKLRQPPLHNKPAIIIVAFGSTGRGRAAMELFMNRVAEKCGDYKVFIAYSSAIVRKKTGHSSIHEALAAAESEGFRRAVVQPLHVFPGTEYRQLAETCEYFPGMRVFLGETLMHRWDYVEEVLEVLEKEFLTESEGLNLLVLHGTPLAADPVNVVYLGLERLIEGRFVNVMAAAVEGVPDFAGLMRRIEREELARRYGRIRLIPMMFLAGIHVEDDLMSDAEGSWKSQLEALGASVSCAQVTHEGTDYFKGIGFYPELVEYYLDRLERALQLADHF